MAAKKTKKKSLICNGIMISALDRPTDPQPLHSLCTALATEWNCSLLFILNRFNHFKDIT